MTQARSILVLPIASIVVPDERIGYFDAAHAAGLGQDMQANGQHDPIHVRRNGPAAKLPWTLIAGLHRLRGRAGTNAETIDAIQVADASTPPDELRRLELSENLDHRQRRPIERALFMAERARLEEAASHPEHIGERPQDRAARLHWNTSATIADVDWRQRTARALGCSLRTLETYQRLHRTIVLELPEGYAERLNFHPLGESLSAMTKLAAQNVLARQVAADAILSRDDWQSMDQVMSEAGLTMSTGNRVDKTKLGVVMMDAWTRMEPAGRKAHVEWLVEKMTPGMAQSMIVKLKQRFEL